MLGFMYSYYNIIQQIYKVKKVVIKNFLKNRSFEFEKKSFRKSIADFDFRSGN